jgi:ATP-dependent RNA helicase DDX54/DBP10
MAFSKRHSIKGNGGEENESNASYSEVEQTDLSEDEVDISSALMGQKHGRGNSHASVLIGAENDDEDLEDIIRDSIAKRDVKGGTEVLRKVKGKGKITKGEVGGGSFQSMGASS